MLKLARDAQMETLEFDGADADGRREPRTLFLGGEHAMHQAGVE